MLALQITPDALSAEYPFSTFSSGEYAVLFTIQMI